MKELTEQEKAALVEFIQARNRNEAFIMPISKFNAMMQKVRDVALAALTAEPEVLYQLWSPGIGQWVECDKVRFDEHSILPAQRRKLFTTPPAPAQQWIKCSERMPEDGQIVTAADIDPGGIDEAATVRYCPPHFVLMNGLEASNYDGGAAISLTFIATHWAPLPAAPEPGGEQ